MTKKLSPPRIAIIAVGKNKRQRQQSLIEAESQLTHIYNIPDEHWNNVFAKLGGWTSPEMITCCDKLLRYHNHTMTLMSKAFKANEIEKILQYIEDETTPR